MAKTTIDKSLFSGLKETLLQKPQTPTQKISIVQKSKSKTVGEEAPFTLWIPKDMMRQIKLKAIDNEKSIKDIILEGIKKII